MSGSSHSSLRDEGLTNNQSSYQKLIITWIKSLFFSTHRLYFYILYLFKIFIRYLCQHVGGTVRGIVLRTSLLLSVAGGDDPCAPPTQAEQSMSASSPSRQRKSYQTSSLTSANVSGCVVNTCSSPLGRVRLLATYIPGGGKLHNHEPLCFLHCLIDPQMCLFLSTSLRTLP